MHSKLRHSRPQDSSGEKSLYMKQPKYIGQRKEMVVLPFSKIKQRILMDESFRLGQDVEK